MFNRGVTIASLHNLRHPKELCRFFTKSSFKQNNYRCFFFISTSSRLLMYFYTKTEVLLIASFVGLGSLSFCAGFLMMMCFSWFEDSWFVDMLIMNSLLSVINRRPWLLTSSCPKDQWDQKVCRRNIVKE